MFLALQNISIVMMPDEKDVRDDEVACQEARQEQGTLLLNILIFRGVMGLHFSPCLEIKCKISDRLTSSVFPIAQIYLV